MYTQSIHINFIWCIHTATHLIATHSTATQCNTPLSHIWCIHSRYTSSVCRLYVDCNTLQHIWSQLISLQHTVTHLFRTLLHTATHCNTLQHIWCIHSRHTSTGFDVYTINVTCIWCIHNQCGMYLVCVTHLTSHSRCARFPDIKSSRTTLCDDAKHPIRLWGLTYLMCVTCLWCVWYGFGVVWQSHESHICHTLQIHITYMYLMCVIYIWCVWHVFDVCDTSHESQSMCPISLHQIFKLYFMTVSNKIAAPPKSTKLRFSDLSS